MRPSLPYWTTLVHCPIIQAAIIDWPAPGVLRSIGVPPAAYA